MNSMHVSGAECKQFQLNSYQLEIFQWEIDQKRLIKIFFRIFCTRVSIFFLCLYKHVGCHLDNVHRRFIDLQFYQVWCIGFFVCTVFKFTVSCNLAICDIMQKCAIIVYLYISLFFFCYCVLIHVVC